MGQAFGAIARLWRQQPREVRGEAAANDEEMGLTAPMDKERGLAFQEALSRVPTAGQAKARCFEEAPLEDVPSKVLHEKFRDVCKEAKVKVFFLRWSLEEAQAFAEALQRNSRLHTLDLTNSNAGPRSHGGGLPQIEALAAGLRATGVITLRLASTGLGDQGVAALAALLKGGSVRSLDLSGNQFRAEGARALAEGVMSSSVVSLKVYGNLIGDEGGKALASILRESSVQDLNLGFTEIGVEGAKALAAGLPSSSVISLSLYSNPLGDEGVKALAVALRPSSLESLDLTGTAMGEDGARALLEGLRNSSVVALELRVLPNQAPRPGDQTLREIEAVLESHRARSLVLQMEVQKLEDVVQVKFRTLAGTEAAVVTWERAPPARFLPGCIMRSSGFRLPSRSFSRENLKLVKPDGALLDVSCLAAPLAEQLGMDVGPPDGPAE